LALGKSTGLMCYILVSQALLLSHPLCSPACQSNWASSDNQRGQTGLPIPTILQWKRSEDLDVDCYNINVSPVISRDLYTVIVCSGMTSVQLLLPSDRYSANLTASNLCNQVSNASRLDFTVEAPRECTT